MTKFSVIKWKLAHTHCYYKLPERAANSNTSMTCQELFWTLQVSNITKGDTDKVNKVINEKEKFREMVQH